MPSLRIFPDPTRSKILSIPIDPKGIEPKLGEHGLHGVVPGFDGTIDRRLPDLTGSGLAGAEWWGWERCTLGGALRVINGYIMV